jgi:hypothetical protein
MAQLALNDQGSLQVQKYITNLEKTQAVETITWEGSFSINPEDRSLAVVTKQPDDIDATPDRFLELWYRFQLNGLDVSLGDKCMAMSYLLRKIMVLHGFKATVQQVVSEYRHPTRRWANITGSERGTGQLNTHAVVLSKGWILDFAQLPLYKNFGAMAPKAVVSRAKFDTWQDLGFFGQIRYSLRPVEHPETRNQRILQRNALTEMVQSYFLVYRA